MHYKYTHTIIVLLWKQKPKQMNCSHKINWDQFLGSWQKWTIFRMKIVTWATTREQKELKISAMLKKKWGRMHFYGYALLNTSCYCRKVAMSLNVLFWHHSKLVICNIKHTPTPPLRLVDCIVQIFTWKPSVFPEGLYLPLFSFFLNIGNCLHWSFRPVWNISL